MIWSQNTLFCHQVGSSSSIVFIIFCFLISRYLIKKRGMYLSWLEPRVKSKAKRESLNVRPVKPHIHAKLTFVCTILFTFMSLLRVRGARLRLSFTVSHDTFPPTWVLFFNWILFFFSFYKLWCQMLSYWLKAYGILHENRLQKMTILSMVKHCAIPELPSPDTTALSHLHVFAYHRADGMKCMNTNKLVLV